MKNIQATGQHYGKIITVKQISKQEAKKLFSQGIEIFLQSSNMYPFGIWQQLCPIKFDQERKESSLELDRRLKAQNLPPSTIEDEIGQFQYLVNSYRWYNCDNERGIYVHFYKIIQTA